LKNFVLVIAAACLAQAQNPMSKETKDLYSAVKGYILKSADKMPEANYSFKPSPDVRSYGQILGHLIDDQYFFCGAAKGEMKESSAEKTLLTKTALVDGLKTAFAYCDSAYDSLTDSKGQMMLKFGRGERTLSGILNFNVSHDFEHYGNLITYLRIKGLVPPSSEKP
jgi:uncharacterized damage-inducible protein DinB